MILTLNVMLHDVLPRSGHWSHWLHHREMTLLLSLNVGAGRVVVVVPIVNIGAKLASYVTVLGSWSIIAYCEITREVLLAKVSLYVNDCHGATVVSVTDFSIPKSGLTTGIVIYAGSERSGSVEYLRNALFSKRPAAIVGSILVTISISDGDVIPAGKTSGMT